MEKDQSTPTPPTIALISGHIDLSEAHFQTHYVPHINEALSSGHSFILGDAVGLDTRALDHLLSDDITSKYPDIAARITIYPSRKSNIEKLQDLGVRVISPDDPSLQVEQTIVVVPKEGKDDRRWHHIQRDANMTAASDYDILYVRSLEENQVLYGERWRPRTSATELNRLRRAELARLHIVRGQAME